MHLALAPMLWSEALGQETVSQFLRIQANSNIFLVNGSYFLREGNGTPLQYFCLENPMDRGAS